MNIKISDKTLCQKSNSFSFKEKLEIARQLEKLNIDVIALPEIENTKADTLLIKTIASFVKNSTISVSAGMTAESLEKAAVALSTAKRARLRIELPVSTVGMEYTCHKKADKMALVIKDLTEKAKAYTDDIEFVAIDATRAENDVLVNLIETAVKSGAKTVTLCDTAAEMLPDKFGLFVKEIAEKFENTTIGVCCDNKNGLAAAEGVCALQNGAGLITTDTSGENIPLETIALVFKNCAEKEGFTSSIKYTEMSRIIGQINWIIGSGKEEKSALSTQNTADELAFNSDDTKDTVINAVLSLGYDLTDDDANKVYEEFLKVAEKKTVDSKELEAIVASVALQVPATYKLVSYVINNGNIIPATAQITLEKDGQNLQGISIGDGPIDSAFLSIEQIIGSHFELDDFQIKSVTEGKQALGTALVKLRRNGKLYSGKGISTDIIGASIRAFLNAVNKIVYEEEI